MRLTQRIVIAAAAAIAMVASAPAIAHVYNGSSMNTFVPEFRSYTGRWPVTITNSQFSNGTGCLTLSGNDAGGSASLVLRGYKYPYGSFLVRNDILVATIAEPLYGQNGALLFIAPANRPHPGQGIYENAEGGSNFDSGTLAFGTKNGC
jgi:hypothetical protein